VHERERGQGAEAPAALRFRRHRDARVRGLNKRRTLAITNYRNISKGGACIITPDSQSFRIGDHLFLMPERYRKKREAVVVALGMARLHLHIARNDELTDFELAEVLQRFSSTPEK
jgi:hypothetical protein